MRRRLLEQRREQNSQKAKLRVTASRREFPKSQSVAAVSNTDVSSALRPIPTIDAQFRNQTKPGCCFTCNKPGHWRAQCPLLAAKSRPGQWLADPKQGQDQRVVVSNCCNAFPSSLDGVGNGLEDHLIDSDYSSSFVTVKSLTLSEFDSCQSKVCSVRGNLAKCYQEWEKIGASGFILSVIHNGYIIPFIDAILGNDLNSISIHVSGYTTAARSAAIYYSCRTEGLSGAC